MRYLDCPTEFKFAAGDTGRFSGYASVTGNVDQGGDMILPGAYKEFAKTKDDKVIVLFAHDTRSPIGKADVHEDSRGLHVDAQLVLSDPVARRVHGLMESGLVDAMSIGYGILPGGEAYKAGRRELSAIKIFEASVVTFGMNPEARIESVKSAMECADVRELEHLLRDTLSLPRRKAAAGANLLWPVLRERDAHGDDRDDREGAAEDQTLVAFRDGLKLLTQLLTKGPNG